MKVLVIGSGGYLGSRLCDRLASDGHDVRRASSSDGTGLDPQTGLLPEAFRIGAGTGVVVYLAHSPFYHDLPSRLDHVLHVNAVSAVRVAERSAAAGVRRFVYASSGSVYRPAWSPLAEDAPLRTDDLYALSKILGETALRALADDLALTVFRPFGIYGPGQSGMLVSGLLARLAARDPVYLEANPHDPSDTGGLRLSLCYVDDAVACLCQAAVEGGPDVVNLAGPEALSVAALARQLGALLGQPPDLRPQGSPGRVGDLVADVSRLRPYARVEWTPAAVGLARTVEAWRA